MTDNIKEFFKAKGEITITATHRGRGEAEGLETITSMRWRDETGQTGQASHVRLALHLERGGEFFIEHDGERRKVEVAEDDRFLHTQGVHDEAADPILKLPTY